MSKPLILLACITFMSMTFSSQAMQKSNRASFSKKAAAIGIMFLILSPTIYADTPHQQEQPKEILNKVFFKCMHSKRTSSHCKYVDCVFKSKTPEQEAQCEYGTHIYPDSPTAISWLTKAAERGSPEAQYNLGNYFYLGEGVKENLILAKKWIRMAAKQKHPKAYDYLFMIYYYEDGIDEAINFFTHEEKKGDASASSTLDEKACVYLEHKFMLNRCIKKAEKGNYQAAMLLGDAFLSKTNTGIKQDTDKAIYFLKKAEIGYPYGFMHYQLATAYCQKTKEFCKSINKKKQKSEGCQNQIQAIRWFDKAKKDGFEKAKKETIKQFKARCGQCCCILL